MAPEVPHRQDRQTQEEGVPLLGRGRLRGPARGSRASPPGGGPEQAEEWHVGDPQEKSPVLGHKPHLHLISEPVFPKQPGEWKPSTATGNLVPRGTGTAPFRARTSEKHAASLGVPVP